MSTIDDLEDIGRMLRAHPGREANPSPRAAAGRRAWAAYTRAARLKGTLSAAKSSAKARNKPITLAPVGGE